MILLLTFVALVWTEEIAVKLRPHVFPAHYANQHGCIHLGTIANLSNFHLLKCPESSSLHLNAARDIETDWSQIQERRQVYIQHVNLGVGTPGDF